MNASLNHHHSKWMLLLSILFIINSPFSRASESIGATSNGCILNAVALPMEGQGYQITHIDQKRFFGHADLIAMIDGAGKVVSKNYWGFILIGDLSAQKGGKILENHKSHQNGLDADILYRMPDEKLSDEELMMPEEPDFVDTEKNRVNFNLWQNKNLEVLKYFATHDRVDRIFVNPAIKKSLCESQSGNRTWLSKLRPWWGHSEHFHVRLKCPEDSKNCLAQVPVSKSDDCNENLDWWLNENISPSKPDDATQKVIQPIPTECQ
jgi:penicillin-insensitive murein endopeptidase